MQLPLQNQTTSMNAKMLLLALLLALTPPVRAQDPHRNLDSFMSPKSSTDWDTSLAHWDRLLRERRNSPGLRLGKSDFVFSGPLIEGFHRQRASTDRNLGQKILSLPIVCLFVPQRMASPPGGTGKYFAWGKSSRPWASVTAGIPPGSAFSSSDVEPRTSLILINR
jgi:hypothetical protein